MRVLFATFAAKSHMFAYVPLAWALRAAGHEVCVASQPDLVKHITRTGLTAVPVGHPLNLEEELREMDELREEVEASQGETVEWASWVELLDIAERRKEKLTYDHVQAVLTAHTSLIFQYFSLQTTVDDLVGFARVWRPDLVVWDTMTFAGPVAAMACGAAHARLLFGLDVVGAMREVYLGWLGGRVGGLRDDPLEEWLGWSLGRYGCGFGEEAVVGQWTIDPVPGSLGLGVGGVRVPVRYVPYNGRSVVPGWVREPVVGGRRRVCVTLGVSHREVLGGDRVSVGGLLEAVADLDVEVVATLDAGQVGGLGRVPDNVRLVDFVPLDVLLPGCSVVVHHGGSGTFQTALWHGVPQVIVPDLRWDTVVKAERLAGFGAGVRVGGAGVGGFGAEELRGVLVRVLGDGSFGERAGVLRGEMVGMPAPGGVVGVLEDLTAHHRASRR